LKEYSILSVLGMGGFGITYLAADNYLQLKVAIKEYFPSSAAVRNQFSGSVALKSEQAEAEYAWGKDRFMREAQTLARFSHKNIVQVFRYFEGNGTCYMVMPYEDGQQPGTGCSADGRRCTLGHAGFRAGPGDAFAGRPGGGARGRLPAPGHQAGQHPAAREATTARC
jgi:aspartate/methionine/tyrosine aminotransferase